MQHTIERSIIEFVTCLISRCVLLVYPARACKASNVHPCFPHLQKAVQENRTAREQEALRERRAKEREELQKRRGSQKVYSKRDSGGGFDLKKELEARKSRTIDVASLERTKQSKALAPPQQDYRHLLRPPKGRSKRGSSGEQQRWSRASDSIPPPSQFAGYDTEDSDDQELEFDDETQF